MTLKEEHRLRVLKNGMQRKMFGTKTWEIGGWRKLHNKECHTTAKHHLGDQMKEDGMGKECGICGRKRNACRVLVGNLEGKRTL